MFRKILIVAAVLVVGAAAPASASYLDLLVEPGQVLAGDAVSVSGKACEPNATVTIYLRPAGSNELGEAVATVQADAEGNFMAEFNVPEGTAPGSYEVVARCGDKEDIQTLEVLDEDVTPPTTPPTTAPGGTTPPGQGPGGTGTGPGGTGTGPGGTGTGALPRTGSDLNGYGLVGAGLLTVGGLFLIGARKRRSTATA